MSLLSNLFQSDAMKNMAFGVVKKSMLEGNYKYFMIELDEQGEIVLKTFTHEQDPVVMSREQITNLEKIMQELHFKADQLGQQLDRSLDENAKLVQMCGEQERHITELMKPGNAAVQEAYNIGRTDGIAGVNRFNQPQTPDNGDSTETGPIVG